LYKTGANQEAALVTSPWHRLQPFASLQKEKEEEEKKKLFD
jgi:hypothetical protein